MQRKNVLEKANVKDASKYKVGIVVSTYYADMITEKLLIGALDTLKEWHVVQKNITIVRVSGCFEIPYGCITLLKRKKFNAIITLGCIVKGETDHDRYIASAVSHGITDLMIAYNVPISFGVLTVNNLAQAEARATGEDNKGIEAATAVLESLFLSKSVSDS